MSFEKPEFLYHGSPNKNIETLEPRSKFQRDKNESPKVFAGNEEIAAMFLARFGDSMTQISTYNEIPVIVIRDRKHFLKKDKGGAIYKLPGNTFENDPSRPFGEREWTSGDSVDPLEKEQFDSALFAMLEKGVQVYFVDKKTFYDFKYDETGAKRYEKLKKFQSENEKRGINFRKLEEE